jgi:predicted lysophospholipase L1 biosynthesis ABC-type transport system permease subunit
LLNLDDVPATNLLQPGNRATWRLLSPVATGETRTLSARGSAVQDRGSASNVRDLRPEVRRRSSAPSVPRPVALVAVLLAAVAVALAHRATAAASSMRRRCSAASAHRSRDARAVRLQFACSASRSALGVVVRARRPAAARALLSARSSRRCPADDDARA